MAEKKTFNVYVPALISVSRQYSVEATDAEDAIHAAENGEGTVIEDQFESTYDETWRRATAEES